VRAKPSLINVGPYGVVPEHGGIPFDEAGGQLDVDRFYRYNQTLQEFFDETAGMDTRFSDDGG
jgi:hypothetical protein